jgi:hypothetical protein
MIPIYRDKEIIQNGMIDKIQSGIFNSDLILSITINSHNIKSLTLRLLKYPLTVGPMGGPKKEKMALPPPQGPWRQIER